MFEICSVKKIWSFSHGPTSYLFGCTIGWNGQMLATTLLRGIRLYNILIHVLYYHSILLRVCGVRQVCRLETMIGITYSLCFCFYSSLESLMFSFWWFDLFGWLLLRHFGPKVFFCSSSCKWGKLFWIWNDCIQSMFF